MKYVTPIGVPKEEGGGKMVFLVIVCIDSYLYTRKKMPTPLYGGEGVKQNLESKNGTQSNRDPWYDTLKCHTHNSRSWPGFARSNDLRMSNLIMLIGVYCLTI
jgi:hypothetical protein